MLIFRQSVINAAFQQNWNSSQYQTNEHNWNKLYPTRKFQLSESDTITAFIVVFVEGGGNGKIPGTVYWHPFPILYIAREKLHAITNLFN